MTDRVTGPVTGPVTGSVDGSVSGPAGGPVRGPRARLGRLGGGAPLFPLIILVALQLFDQATQSAFNVLIPNIRDAFHLSDAEILAISAGAGASALLGTVPVAWLADRSNRVRIALVGAGAAAVISVALGLAPTAAVMAVMLCGVYVGQAVIFPTHNSLIADSYPVPARPRVYSIHRGGLSLGAVAGVLIGAGLTAAFSWRVPFVVFAIPILVVVAVGAVRLHEPPRGRYEEQELDRRAIDDVVTGAVADAEAALPGPPAGGPEPAPPPLEPPPSFGEAWRMVWKIRVLRRIFVALPFLAAAIAGFTSLASLQYQQTFHLDELQRAYLVAPVQVFVLGGLVLGATVATRLAARGLHLVFAMLAVAAVVASAFAILFALAPSVVVAFFADAGIEASLAIVGPGVLAGLSLAIPSRARSVGFSIGALFVLPGLIVIPLVGLVGDHVGFRYGMLILVPVFLIGGLIVASAGSLIDGDVHNVWLSMRARAEMLAARARGELPLLAVRGLAVGYEGVPVLRHLDLEVAEGEVVALLGTNGAGKSTLLRAIGGVVEADGGAVIFDGRDVTHTPPDEIARLGIGQMPGGEGVFPTLTVEENLRAAAWQERRHRRRAEERVASTLDRFGLLAERRGDRAGDLSGGQQQMLALAMALLAAPKLLLVDELSLGLAPIVVEQLLDSVRELRSAGTAVLLVEQSVNVAVAVADRVYVMDSGEIRFSGSAAEVHNRPELLWSIYLHHAAAAMAPGPGPDGDGVAVSDGDGVAVSDGDGVAVSADDGVGVSHGDGVAESAADAVAGGAGNGAIARIRPWGDREHKGDERHGNGRGAVLQVVGATVTFGGIGALDDVSLAAWPGEVIGIIGPNGAGKTTLFDVVSGFTRPRPGRVLVDGTDVTSLAPARRARLGLGRSFQDSRLFSGLSVRDTLAVALERFVDTGDPLNAVLRLPALVDTEAAVAARVDELIELFGLQRFATAFVSELSTGTRRLVDLAAVVAHAPTLVLLDEPSSGVAQREVEAMGELLRRVRRLGATLVLVEHNIPFVSELADRLVALDRGQVLAEGGPGEVLARAEVIEAFLGNEPLVGTTAGDTEERTP